MVPNPARVSERVAPHFVSVGNEPWFDYRTDCLETLQKLRPRGKRGRYATACTCQQERRTLTNELRACLTGRRVVLAEARRRAGGVFRRGGLLARGCKFGHRSNLGVRALPSKGGLVASASRTPFSDDVAPAKGGRCRARGTRQPTFALVRPSRIEAGMTETKSTIARETFTLRVWRPPYATPETSSCGRHSMRIRSATDCAAERSRSTSRPM